MDMSKYAGASFVAKGDLAQGPVRATIIAVTVDKKYDRPNLLLEDGSQVALNKTNTARLVRVFGKDSAVWPGHEIEMFLGPGKDKEGKEIETIITKPLGPAVPAAASPPAVNGGDKPKSDMDDDIPF